MSNTEMSVESVCSVLTARRPLPPLHPKQIWSFEISDWLNSMDLSPALTGALLMWNDDLSGSHTIAQGLYSSLGSWLHGALHRREGDFSNSKYWFRRVDEEKVLTAMSKHAAKIINVDSLAIEEPALATIKEKWDPFIFVDLCAAAVSDGTVIKSILEQLQAAELSLLAELATGYNN